MTERHQAAEFLYCLPYTDYKSIFGIVTSFDQFDLDKLWDESKKFDFCYDVIFLCVL